MLLSNASLNSPVPSTLLILGRRWAIAGITVLALSPLAACTDSASLAKLAAPDRPQVQFVRAASLGGEEALAEALRQLQGLDPDAVIGSTNGDVAVREVVAQLQGAKSQRVYSESRPARVPNSVDDGSTLGWSWILASDTAPNYRTVSFNAYTDCYNCSDPFGKVFCGGDMSMYLAPTSGGPAWNQVYNYEGNCAASGLYQVQVGGDPYNATLSTRHYVDEYFYPDPPDTYSFASQTV